MKKILSIFLSFCLIFTSFPNDRNVNASQGINLNFVKKDFFTNKVDIELTPIKEMKKISSIFLYRKGLEIEQEKASGHNWVPEGKYFLGEDKIIIGELIQGDIIGIEIGSIKYYFKYENESFKTVTYDDIDIDKPAEEGKYKLTIKKDTNTDYTREEFIVNSKEKIENINKIFKNDKELESTEDEKDFKNQGYINTNKDKEYYLKRADTIVLADLKDRDKIVFKDKSDNVMGAYRYISNGDKFIPLLVEDKNSNEGGNTGEKPNEGDQSNPDVTSDKIVSISEGSDSTGVYSNTFLLISPAKVEIMESIGGLTINKTDYTEVGAKISLFGNKYLVDKDSFKVYVSEQLKDGDIIIFKDKSDKEMATFVKENNKYVNKTGQDYHDKDLKVKISGKFEAALVGQKKYDAISGATGNVNQNKNSNVNVYVQEVEHGQDAVEDKWILLKDSGIRVVKSSDNNKTRGMIEGNGSGMSVLYNTYDSSLTLQGTPENEGEYSVSVVIVDNKGREAESNRLPFKIYDVNKVKLIDQLVEGNFEKFPHGDDYKWDMEPWEIHTFGGENETVTIPNNLKAWFGSHKSGTYAYLGRPSENEDEIVKQTLIIPENRSFSFVNMQLLTSVDVIVKKGAKLNINDSVIYGRVIVEDGGILQVNYNEMENKFTTGSSINGKIILKEGAILENSAIYSNTNFNTDGKLANKNTDPIVEVVGDAIIRGNVFIRGDEAPTGSDENGEPLTGQKALIVKDAKLTVEKDSTLGLYGGGKSSLTTNGGDALILENASIDGEGTLIAFGGTAGGLAKKFKGGDAVSGSGNILIKNAYLQGGYATSDKVENYGKPFTKNIKISKHTVGEANIGKSVSSIENSTIPDGYWHDHVAPGNDQNHNPLEATQIKDDITIKDRLDLPQEQIVEELDEEEPGTSPEEPGTSPSTPVIPPSSNNEEVEESKRLVERIAGKDRYETSIELSKKYFKNADTVIIARSDVYPDALSASMLSKVKKAPILLTPSEKLLKIVEEEIQRLGAKNVIIVGGDMAISKDVEKALGDYKLERLAGKDRYETSAKIARKLAEENDIRERAIIASGQVWADALAAGSFSSSEKYPILLVEKDLVPEAIDKAIKELGIKEVYIVGGSARISEDVKSQLPSIVKEFAGENRYETASLLAEYAFSDSKRAYLASGESFADSLIIGGVAGAEDAPILLTGQKVLDKETKDYLGNSKIEKISVIGGIARISKNIEGLLKK